jgi:hypothetical protein
MEKRMSHDQGVFASVAGMQNGRFVMPHRRERSEDGCIG